MRALIVDDERPARERLRLLLGAFDDVEIVGEAEDGEQAIERILDLKPDLVLLDIQMPGCSGLEVVASLPAPRPQVVFCTAYDEHAVDAFELHAVDYLLKPITRARLEKAVARVRARAGAEHERALAGAQRSTGSYPARFLARLGARFLVVAARDVLYFASEGGQTRLQARDQHYWMQPTLADLEQRLDPMRFCRISRAAIVSLDAVREVVPLPGGGAEARLVNGATLEVSRRRVKELMGRLGTG